MVTEARGDKPYGLIYPCSRPVLRRRAARAAELWRAPPER
jgi:hypothetical protein